MVNSDENIVVFVRMDGSVDDILHCWIRVAFEKTGF